MKPSNMPMTVITAWAEESLLKIWESLRDVSERSRQEQCGSTATTSTLITCLLEATNRAASGKISGKNLLVSSLERRLFTSGLEPNYK